MRTTVGPLPPAVYWRRRAAVLGALLLVVLLVVWSCSRLSDDSDRTPGAQGSPTPTVSPGVNPAPGGSADGAAPGATPGAGPQEEEPPPGQPPAQVAPPGGGDAGPTPDAGVTVAAGGPPADGSCTDEEIAVTPVPASTTARRGETIDIRLRIRNVSQRTCNRDVGADLQEVYIKQGAQKVWSSDVCGNARGSNVQRFTPNFGLEYYVAWNGRDTTSCAGTAANGPVPPAGQYEVFGRLGSKLSAPVRLTLTG